ncbi:alpha-galactosidase [Arthrobacter sp. NtRootA1]|uniref:alpha-galactosidase n=1 Tax=Arthrobacter sp. NtRootA1 TaxID=2830983 RepID=UPI001CC66ED1|nr:alpha-galactosidase [Arthrobacter sp. NtRootA1]BCW06279.1 alpha-galactosidase [Arthrobacter sp. NtRootA1]
MPTDNEGAILHLAAAGVSVLIDATGGQLPAIVHWGDQLPALTAEEARKMVEASVPVAGSSTIDVPPRPGLLPGQDSGWMGRPGLRGSFDGVGWSPKFQVHKVTFNDSPAIGFVAAEAGRVLITGTDDAHRLRLDLTLELLPAGLIRGRVELTNLCDETYTVEDVSLAFPIPGEATELLDFAGSHNFERVPQRGTLRTGTHLRENRKGRTGSDSAYILHAGTPGFGFGHGEIWAVHTAWSGNHHHFAERFFGDQLIGGGELLLPGEVRLSLGDIYQSPWIYASYGTGLDAVARRFHAHVRSRTFPVSADRPVTLNVWEAVYFDHEEEKLIALAERAALAGVERYVLDDGWFGSRRDDTSGLGDWVVSADVWPSGLHPLVGRVHEMGMQFGLWFEPEMVNPDSDVARAHPEWIMAARKDWPVESRNQQVLNLAVPEAYEHVKKQILALLAEYKLDYIKWDHNRDLIEAGNQQAGGRPAVHQQTLAFYALLEEIRSLHPDVEIESCSSGGARVDLGVLENTDRVWVSDNNDPHDRQTMLRWTTELLPPEYLGSHIASARSHTTGRRHDLAFRAGTAVFGHLGVEWDLGTASDDELDSLQRWISFYKQERRLLLAGDVVRMDGPDTNVVVHGVVGPDRSRAIFAQAALDSLYPDPAGRLRFRGLDAEARYEIVPIFPGYTPSGLLPPDWWGQPSASGRHIEGTSLRTTARNDVTFPGAVFSGSALEKVGVASPRIHPDQVVLYRLSRVACESQTRNAVP